MAEFEGTIEVGYHTDSWGTYKFTFPICTTADANDGLIPYGAVITAITVKAYVGNVTRKSTLADETIIADLIDATPSVQNDNEVVLSLTYPTAVSYKGQKATLIFEVTITSAPTKAFYFQYVYIR